VRGKRGTFQLSSFAEKIIVFLLPFFFLICCVPRFTFSQEAVFKNFTTRDGLPSQEVYHVYQDKKGYIWACTDAGIARYDGNHFKIFNSTNGLPDNTIFQVKEDSDGRLWFRSISGKTGYILNDSVFTVSANEKLMAFCREGLLVSFAIDKYNNILFGRQIDDAISFIKISPPYDNAHVQIIWKDTSILSGLKVVLLSNGDVVFSERRSPGPSNLLTLIVYDEEQQFLFGKKIENSSPLSRITRVGDVLYVANQSLITEYRKKENKVSSGIIKGNIIGITGAGNDLWIGLRNEGALHLKTVGNDTLFRRFLPGRTVSFMCRDFQNGYWFSTLESGLFYLPNYNYFFSDNTNGKEAVAITCLGKISGNSIISGDKNGNLFMLTVDKNGAFKKNKIFIDTGKELGYVNAFAQLGNGKRIVTGGAGALMFNTDNGNFNKVLSNFKYSSTSIPLRKLVGYKGKLLFFNFKNVYVADTSDFLIRDTIFCDDRLTSVVYDEQEDICYFGGIHGLYQYRGGKAISQEQKLLNLRIEDLKIGSGRLVIVTKEKGIVIKDKNRFDTIGTANGLISDICRKVEIQNDTIWLVTSNGISRIVYHGFKQYEVVNYSLNSFPSLVSVSNMILLENYLVFSSESKIFFYPLEKGKRAQRFYISGFRVNGVLKNPGDNTRLSYSESNIYVAYEALFYKNLEKPLYRYKFSPGDTSWIYTGETSVSFSSLSPGQYVFTIEARDETGNWVEADRRISFAIDKPFWQTGWFISLGIIAAAMVTGGGVFYRNRKLLLKERAQYKVKLQLQELQVKAIKVQMNPHFIFNSLNAIQNFILSAENDNALRYLSKFSKLVRKLLETSTEEYISLENEIDILNRYMEIEALRFEDSFRYTLTVDPSLSLSGVKIPQMMVQPFVENAIWHGLLHKSDNRKLAVSFAKLSDRLILCRVDDNGAGRQAKKGNNLIREKKSLALELISERLFLIEQTRGIAGRLEIKDKFNPDGSPAGTLVEIVIPSF
jgi:ligand-binding sensor domain-containing protein